MLRVQHERASIMSRGGITVTAVLLAILAATIWWAWQGWTAHSDVQMSVHGFIAMGLGIFFSLFFGFGLMALTFYSSRQGYDDLPQAKELPAESAGNKPAAHNIP
jgi:TRAP-type C4-dicarboxylate transport system permease small subunit